MSSKNSIEIIMRSVFGHTNSNISLFKVSSNATNIIDNDVSFKDENGEFHNENDPAYEIVGGKYDGEKYYLIHGLHHREDGPAIIFPDGTKYYCFNDKKYENIKSDEQWIKFVKVLKLLE